MKRFVAGTSLSAITNEKHRVAVIGCGGIAKLHIGGYLKCGRYEIVALADLHEAAMAETDAEFGIAPGHYTDVREMFEKEKIDVVSVCTWHIGHADMTIAAAAHQPKAILCEKPMADTVGRAEQMLVACERNGVKLATAHQRRFLPSYCLARNLIAEGAVGDVQIISYLGGQGLPNFCSHQTDMIRYILNDDDCTWVMGNIERKTDRYERNTRIEDRAEAVFQFAGGARALILCDLAPNFYQGAHIFGAAGMIGLTTGRLQMMNESTGGRWESFAPDGRFAKAGEARFEWIEGGAGQVDELADWIEGKIEVHRGEARHGFQALQMIHAIYESARCHERVAMPLQTRLNPLDLMVDSGHLAPERPGKYEIRAQRLRGESMESDSQH